MDEIIKTHIGHLSVGVETCAALIIALAVLQATLRALHVFFVPSWQREQQQIDVRLRLGRWLSLALEFALAADILRTILAPTWEEIGKLAAIIFLRTLLNFFLEREIHRDAERKEANRVATA